MTDELKALLAIFSDDELLWFRAHLNNEGLDPEDRATKYRLIEAISNELIERGLIKLKVSKYDHREESLKSVIPSKSVVADFLGWTRKANESGFHMRT